MLKALRSEMLSIRASLLAVHYALNNEENVNPESVSVHHAIEETEAALTLLDAILLD